MILARKLVKRNVRESEKQVRMEEKWIVLEVKVPHRNIARTPGIYN